jgi:predicted flap endonuclease-1-like 5' DNA nuclease
MAHAQQQQLADGRARLAADTTTFRGELDDTHQAMAHAQRQQLAGGRARLAADTTTLRGELDDTHQAMADTQRESMTAARQGLASDVASARRGFQAEQGAVRTDQRGARLVWQALAGLKQQRRTMKPAAIVQPIGKTTSVKNTVSVQSTVVTKAAPAPEPGRTLDDLKAIRGIGASMQQRLNQAGIRTFAQLAASTPAALRQALGDVSRLAKVEAWIAQARELTN